MKEETQAAAQGLRELQELRLQELQHHLQGAR
jgi:hypothetical protein